jgi:Omp85 superfamily domain
MKFLTHIFFFTLLVMSSIVAAQDYELSKIEDKAKQKYLTNNSKKVYRYRDKTEIKNGEFIDGNVVVVKGDLSVYGEITGDVLVIYGDIRVKNGASINGNTTAVDGRIYQDKNAIISGNQVETHAKNLISHEEWGDDYEYNYSYDYSNDTDDDDWEWSWSQRYYGSYSTLPLRQVDDPLILRYNRVQGLFLGLGIPKWIGGKYNYFALHGFAGYGFKEKKARYQLGLDRWLFNNRDYRFEIGAKVYDLTDSRDEWLLSTTENSLTSFFVKDDYHDFYRRSGYEVHISQNFTIFLKGTLAYRNEQYESVKRNANWSLFNNDDKFRENPAINDGDIRSVYAELYLDTRDNIQLPRKGWFGLLGIESSTKGGLNSDFSFNQYTLELRRYQNFGYKERLDMRLKIGSSEGVLPLQKKYQIGGLSTLRGFGYKDFQGDRMLLANFEYNLNPRIFSTDLLFLDELNYVIFYDIGDAWDSNPVKDDQWYEGFSKLRLTELNSDLGLALTFNNGNYRISMAKRLDTGRRSLNFIFRIIKPF